MRVLALLALSLSAAEGFLAPQPLSHSALRLRAQPLSRSAPRPLSRLATQPLRRSPLGLRASASLDEGMVEEQNLVTDALLASASSRDQILGDALSNAIRDAAAKLPEGTPPDFCFLFLSSTYCQTSDSPLTSPIDGKELGAEAYAKVIPIITKQFMQRGWTKVPIIGCTVSGTISASGEEEASRGVSISFGRFPGATVKAFQVPSTYSEDWKPKDWVDNCGLIQENKPSTLIVLGAPQQPTFLRKVIGGMDFSFPGAKVVGGLAACAQPTHQHSMFYFSGLEGPPEVECLDEGVIGLQLSGDIAVDAVVAQGSRPIGPNFQVVETSDNGTVITRMREVNTETEAEGAPMTLFDLAGYAGAMTKEEVVSALDFIALGFSLNPLEDDLNKHEYVVRPIKDLQKDGPVFLDDEVRPGQIVRFHIRDSANATDEVEGLMTRWKLERTARRLEGKAPAGALLFCDQDRGVKLFGKDNVDSSSFLAAFPDVELGGGFVSGAVGELPNFKDRELGPVSDSKKNLTSILTQVEETYLHSVGAAFLMLYGNASAPEA